MAFSAIFDACVFYPAPLRDILMSLATSGIFRARWTQDIQDEWLRNLLKNRPDLSPERLKKTQQTMNRAVPDCLIHDYEALIPALTLPDPDDRHVLAAAITGRCDVIVTFNLKDFPASSLSGYRIEAQHPDVFVHHLFDLNPAIFLKTLRENRQRLKSPCQTSEVYLEVLEKQGLTTSVQAIKSFEFLI